MSVPAVELRGIVKRFGSFVALDQVDLAVMPGTIHAVVGENGAGKTTLMRVLYGSLAPDAGEVVLEGQPHRFRGASEGIAAGVGMVSQHYSIIPELSCLQNLMLGAEPGLVIPIAQARRRAQELAERMGFTFDWSAPASMLGPAGAQKLEILKLLWRSARIMILDEPTAMLSPQDANALFVSLRNLADEGATILLVTHRIPEVLNSCDRVLVLRGGKRIDDRPVQGLEARELANLIVGHDVAVPTPPQGEPAGPVVIVRDLSVRGQRGDEAVKRVSFTLRAGEIVGLAGVDGNGQRELVHALLGVTPPLNGTIALDGEPIQAAGPAERLRRGVRLIAEDRHAESVVEAWSLEENVALGLQRLPPLNRGGWVDRAARSALAEKVAARFATKHSGLHRPIAHLSGGNQQRFVVARALELGPRLVVAFQPSRGLDIDATAQVFAAFRAMAEAGAAILVVSFDLDELLEYTDRILTICGGRLAEPDAEHSKDRTEIGRLIAGVA